MVNRDVLPIGAAREALVSAQSEWGGGIIVGNKLMPLQSHFDSMFEEKSCSIGGHWYVVQADARQHKIAVKSVAAEGYPAYQPIVVKYAMKRGRKVRVESTMFGMYFFVKCDMTEDDYHRIRLARGVRKFLDISATGRPLMVPNWAMDIVRLKEAEYGTPEGKSRFVYHFSPGDVVRIKDGPFALFYAKLESAVDEHGRLRALVDIFGRPTKVEFEAHQLEAL